MCGLREWAVNVRELEKKELWTDAWYGEIGPDFCYSSFRWPDVLVK